MAYVIRCIALATRPDVRKGHEVSPVPHFQWLVDCDFNARGGRGLATWTHYIDRAKRFPDLGAAMAYWRTQSDIKPFRPDGQANRPLTAYTVEMEQVP